MADQTQIKQIANRLGMQFLAEIHDADTDSAWLSRLPLSFAKANLLLPMRDKDGILLVAMGDPTNLLALDELQGALGTPVKGVVSPPEEVLSAINRLYARHSGSAQEVVAELEADELSTVASQFNRPQDLLDLTDEAPVIRLLNSILFQAVKERASDIHIEPFERELDVRFRIDGILYKMLSPPKLVQESLTSRVKIMAGLNIAEKRLPQDGRITLRVGGRPVDVRVSTLPTGHGERVTAKGLAFAATGSLFPFFSPFLGWRGAWVSACGPGGSGCSSSCRSPPANITAAWPTCSRAGRARCWACGSAGTGSIINLLPNDFTTPICPLFSRPIPC